MPRIDEFVGTDIQFQAKFTSAVVTVGDAAAFFTLLGSFFEAVENEVMQETGLKVHLLPVLTVRGGSIEAKVKVEVKVDSESAEKEPLPAKLKSKLRAIILGALLALVPDESAVTKITPPPTADSKPAVSYTCEGEAGKAWQTAMDGWEKFGKGFTADFHVKAGDVTIDSKINVPASSAHSKHSKGK
jgi:hypothetical protein